MNFPKQSLLEQAPVALDFSSQAPSYSAFSASKPLSSWVTCLGLPVDGDNLELLQQHFAYEKGLSIVDYFPKDQSNANFLRVKFQTPKEMAVALGENGKVIEFKGKRFMLGVAEFPNGDQLGSTPPTTAAAVVKPQNQSAPVTPWQRAMVWIMDM